MPRFTFTCEHFDYDFYRAGENDIASKHTTEFSADDLTTMLENFEMFLHGAGFHFDGVIDVVKPDDERDAEEDLRAIDDFIDDQRGHRVFDSMVNTLLKDEPTDSFGDIFISTDDMEIDTTYTIDESVYYPQYSTEFSESEYCSLCKLPISVMKLHQCFDVKCPSGSYRNQYAN